MTTSAVTSLLPRCGARQSAALVGVALYAVLLLTTLVYWRGLDGDLLLDDFANLHPLGEMDRDVVSWRDAVFSSASGSLGRPVAMLTFTANMVFNGPNVWAFKYTNLMIHLLCGVLIFWLSGRLFSALVPTLTQTRTWSLSLAVTAIWLLSPLLVSTTLYLVQRMTQLSALFTLCGLLAYTGGRQRLDTNPPAGWGLILSSILLWLPLAAFSKENGVLLPLLLLIVEIFIFRFAGATPSRRGLYAFFLLFVALPALLVAARLVVSPDYVTGGYVGRPFTLTERLLTESRALFFYVGNLIVPHGTGMGLFHDDYTVSKSLLAPPTTILSIMGWALILASAFLTRRWRAWPLFFGPLFFLAGHALESGVLALELVFEHRNYLPSFGIFFSMVLGLHQLMERLPGRKAVSAFLILLPLLYGFATFQRASTWSSWGEILLSAETVHPNSPRLHAELAGLYAVNNDLESALAHLDKVTALRESAESAVALHRIVLYCKTKRSIPASVYESFPPQMTSGDAGIYTVNTLRGINQLVYRHECPQLDIPQLVARLKTWIRNSPPDQHSGRLWDTHYEMAQLLFYNGHIPDALEQLRRADRLAPSRPEALLVMMRYQLAANNAEEARATLRELRSRFYPPTDEQKSVIARYREVIETIDNIPAGAQH